MTLVIEEMDTVACELLSLAQRAAATRRAYEQAQASAWLAVQGTKATEATKKAMVHFSTTDFEGEEVTVGDLRYMAEVAEAVVDSKRAAMRAMGYQADMLRSLLATNRAVV